MGGSRGTGGRSLLYPWLSTVEVGRRQKEFAMRGAWEIPCSGRKRSKFTTYANIPHLFPHSTGCWDPQTMFTCDLLGMYKPNRIHVFLLTHSHCLKNTSTVIYGPSLFILQVVICIDYFWSCYNQYFIITMDHMSLWNVKGSQTWDDPTGTHHSTAQRPFHFLSVLCFGFYSPQLLFWFAVNPPPSMSFPDIATVFSDKACYLTADTYTVVNNYLMNIVEQLQSQIFPPGIDGDQKLKINSNIAPTLQGDIICHCWACRLCCLQRGPHISYLGFNKSSCVDELLYT